MSTATFFMVLLVPVQKSANLFEIKACEKFYRRHIVDIPRIKFFAQRRYRANWPFMDRHLLERPGLPVLLGPYPESVNPERFKNHDEDHDQPEDDELDIGHTGQEK